MAGHPCWGKEVMSYFPSDVKMAWLELRPLQTCLLTDSKHRMVCLVRNTPISKTCQNGAFVWDWFCEPNEPFHSHIKHKKNGVIFREPTFFDEPICMLCDRFMNPKVHKHSPTHTYMFSITNGAPVRMCTFGFHTFLWSYRFEFLLWKPSLEIHSTDSLWSIIIQKLTKHTHKDKWGNLDKWVYDLPPFP